MNVSDSSRLSAFLISHKYKQVVDPLKAGLVIINTCGIRQSAEDRAYDRVHKIRKNNKSVKIVLTGCLSKREDIKKRLASKVDLFMPISESPDLLSLLEKRKLKSQLSLDEVRVMQGEKYLSIVPDYPSSYSAYVPIGNGCNNFCSYCVVPYARGREVYRLPSQIVKEVRDLVKSGYKEVILIAQNVNSYNKNNYDFPKLLEKIALIKGDFWLRFSSSHPKDVSDDLIAVMGKYEKICPHLHLALQSGDDEILKAMNRKYQAKDFLKIVEKVRKARPGIAITTDIIVGFPGETRKNFLNTISVYNKVKFDQAYISRYSPRPQTASYSMEDNVSRGEKARRERELEARVVKYLQEKNETYLGKTCRVLVEGKNSQDKLYGKTATYKPVIFSVDKSEDKDKLIGQFCNVAIERLNKFRLEV